MKRLARAVFIIFVVTAWVVDVAIALEIITRISWKQIQAKNPYTLARVGKGEWPGDENAKLQAPPPPPRPTGPLEPDPNDYRRAHSGWRRATFSGLSEEQRNMSCPVWNEFILSFDDKGGAKSVYGQPFDARFASPKNVSELDSLMNGNSATRSIEITTAINDVLASGSERSLQWTPQGQTQPMDVLIFPLKLANGTKGVATSFETPIVPSPPESEWVIPFFAYRKHSFGKTDFMRPGEFHTNNMGFRDDDVILPKPQGVFRIVCVGASTTEEGEDNRNTYPNILEDKLNASAGPVKFDVINCGIRGMTSLKEWLRFDDYLSLQPDLIIYYDGVNDLCHWLFQNWIFQASPMQKRLRESQFICHHFNRALYPSRDKMTEMMEQKTLAGLRAMRDAAQKTGVKIAFCSFAKPDPSKLSKVVRDYYENDMRENWGGVYVTLPTYIEAVDILNEQIRKMCEEGGALYIPVAENMNDGIEHFGDICHMRHLGIVKKADVIAKGIESVLPH